MKKINSSILLESLCEQTRRTILEAEQLKLIPIEALETNPSTGKWSVAQVLEHLNFYCRYYFDAIENKLHHNQTTAATYFSAGWLGNYFTQLMQPESNGIQKKKMKSPANAQPATGAKAKPALDEFINHQHHLLHLLQVAKQHNLNTNRIPISICKYISLKLGDTFLFVLAHQQRHLLQIVNTLALVEKKGIENLQIAG